MIPHSLTVLTDEQLWSIVKQPLEQTIDSRLSELSELGGTGQLTTEEYDELERLVEQLDQHIFTRSQALFLLKQHGHNVEGYLKLGI